MDISIHPSIHPSFHPSIHPCIHTHIYTQIHTQIHTYIHTYVHKYTYLLNKNCRVFRNPQNLLDHVSDAHRRRLCLVCLQSRRQFARDLRVYLPRELDEHMSERHPTCQFCRRDVYDNDELFDHMRLKHYQCTICLASTGEFSYFASPQSLYEHNVEKHFVCHEVSGSTDRPTER
jgi:hypothetical protein